MMKIARVLIAISMMVLCISPTYAEGYNVLVIPDGYVRNTHKNLVKSVDIEEMLARKFISKMEEDGMAYAPTTSVLKISINNNSKFDKTANEPLENIRIISKAYGVPKVLIIHTKTEMSSNTQQKMFWNRLDLPVLVPFEPNMRLMTTVTMYNAKNNEVIWSDVYYKKIALKNNGVELSDLNKYYDELIPKVFDNIKDSKETHAIMVHSPSDLINNDTVEKKNPIIQFFENIKNSITIKQIEKQEKLLDEKIAEKKAKENKKVHKKPEPNVIKKPTPNLEMKSDTKVVKNEEKTKKGFMHEVQFKFYIVKQDLFKNIKNEFDNPERNATVQRQKTAKKVLKEKQVQEKKTKVKQVKQKPQKEVKTAQKKSYIDTLKLKYHDIKIKSAQKQDSQKKVKTVEEPKYKYLIESMDDSVSVNRYIQSKPRYNSRNYVPKYDSDVNDI